ncbi:MAG: hypothetical protein AAGF20_03775 [Pseudomonadota bacterium]
MLTSNIAFRIFARLKICLAFISLCLVVACNSGNIATDVTDEQWADDTIWKIMDEQSLPLEQYAAFFELKRSEHTPIEATYIGLIQMFGPAELHNKTSGIEMLSYACGEGIHRACRTFGRQMVYWPEPAQREPGEKMLIDACDAGIRLACHDLTLFYATTASYGFDPDKALSYAEFSCANGDVNHCSMSMHALRSIRPDVSEPVLAAGCERQHHMYCKHLGHGLVHGHFGQNRFDEALDAFNLSCLYGLVEGCDSLFYHQMKANNVSRTFMASEAIAEKICLGGHTKTCHRLSTYFGTGYTNRLSKSFLMQSAGCEQDDVAMCRWYATSLLLGNGVEENADEAERILRKLCAQHDQDSCYRVREFEWPNNVRDDNEQNEIACDFGDLEACRSLGLNLIKGRNIEKDAEAAKALFAKACDAGHAISCSDLGNAYLYPDNDHSLDLIKARNAYTQACRNGYRSYCEEAAKLSQRIAGNPS